MKKLLSIVIALTMALGMLSLVSCQSDTTKLRVAVLNGTTGFGIAPLMSKLKSGETDLNAEINIYTAADMVSPLLINGDADIAAVPTNLAAVLANKTAKDGKSGVRVLAVNTLGVLYLIENGETVNTLADLEGKTVGVPGKGSNPEFILRALTELAGLKNVEIDSSYTSPDELATALASGKLAIGLLPEPKVTAVLSKSASLRVAIDFTSEWKKYTDAPLAQGCIIVRTDFAEKHPGLVNAFLDEYKKSVELVSSDPESASVMIADAGLIAKAELAKAALPRCNITYLDGEEMKNALIGYWKALFALDAKSVGGKLPGDDIFDFKTK